LQRFWSWYFLIHGFGGNYDGNHRLGGGGLIWYFLTNYFDRHHAPNMEAWLTIKVIGEKYQINPSAAQTMITIASSRQNRL